MSWPASLALALTRRPPVHLFGMQAASDPRALADLERYGLGRARTLAEYEMFAGVNFRARSVSDRARRGQLG